MRAWANCYDVDTVSLLRYANVSLARGEVADSGFPSAVIAAFAKAMLNGKPPVIFGDGETSRDFTYVENAVHANLLAARATKDLHGDVFNVACGENCVSLNRPGKNVTGFGSARPDLELRCISPSTGGDVRHSLAGWGIFERLWGIRRSLVLPMGCGRRWNGMGL